MVEFFLQGRRHLKLLIRIMIPRNAVVVEVVAAVVVIVTILRSEL